jgi:hypothetical protein
VEAGAGGRGGQEEEEGKKVRERGKIVVERCK